MGEIIVILAGIALFLLGFYVFAQSLPFLLNPLLTLIQNNIMAKKFTKGDAHLVAVAKFIDNLDYPNAIEELEKALVISQKTTPALMDRARKHEQNLLRKSFLLADAILQDNAEGQQQISKIERLLQERTELEALMFKTRQYYQRITNVRSPGHRATPQWTKIEYGNKIDSIASNIDENTFNTKQAFSEFIKELKTI